LRWVLRRAQKDFLRVALFDQLAEMKERNPLGDTGACDCKIKEPKRVNFSQLPAALAKYCAW